MAVDHDLLRTQLTLFGTTNDAQLFEAIVEPPDLHRTVDGASTLSVVVKDVADLLASGILNGFCWALVDDVAFQLVRINKAGMRATLTFEDSVVAALRNRKAHLSIPASTTTFQAFVQRLADEAGVTAVLDPTPRGVVNEVLERSVAGSEPTDSWRLISDGAEKRGWRAYSNGVQLVVGGDDWLATIISPWNLKAENTGPVHFVDFDLDVGRPDNGATIDVDALLWAVMPGRAVNLPTSLGPASGRWLVQTFDRALTGTRATVALTRPRQALPEPPPEVVAELAGMQDMPSGVAQVLGLSGIRTTGPKASSSRPAPQNPRQADQQSKPAGSGQWAWPTYDKRVTSGFGPRKSPGGVGSTNHKGIDIGAGHGSQVFAARAGKVTTAGYQSGYGNVVYLDHGEGVSSRYAHLSQIDCSVGQRVTIGSQVGRVGATGTATGPHLHFEVLVNGDAQNPLNYLPR